VGQVRAARGLTGRRRVLDEIDEAGILATPANSFYNELVIEAGRQSILARGRSVRIRYGRRPGIIAAPRQ